MTPIILSALTVQPNQCIFEIGDCGCKLLLTFRNYSADGIIDAKVPGWLDITPMRCALHENALALYERCESLLQHAESEHQFYGELRIKKTLALLAKAMPPHTHVASGNGDSCKKCGKDLRNPIHHGKD